MKDCVLLIQEISTETETLETHVRSYGLNHRETIEQSQKLDELIVKYQQLNLKGDKQ